MEGAFQKGVEHAGVVEVADQPPELRFDGVGFRTVEQAAEQRNRRLETLQPRAHLLHGLGLAGFNGVLVQGEVAQTPPADALERFADAHGGRDHDGFGEVRSCRLTAAQRKAALGRAPVYMYLFEWRSLADPKLLAHHGLEIAFAFDNTSRVPAWSGGGASAAALAAKMSEAWLEFARSGNPATPELPAWPAYTAATRATMRFDDECTVTNDPDREVRQLWATV